MIVPRDFWRLREVVSAGIIAQPFVPARFLMSHFPICNRAVAVDVR
ncbi:hypothetical protein [Dokdonella immobilis]|nr:hypothetical protein [Dokdonella immobilis]